ncbi:MAG: hypothetical protein JJV98_15630 [Desulfosarcina sp.]|nr:hypothetical protein [Desulfobacterales bacterium]
MHRFNASRMKTRPNGVSLDADGRKKTARSIRRTAGLTLFLLFCLGCATDGPRDHFADDYGDIYRQGFAAQVIHPEAGTACPPVDTLPADIALEIYDNRYVNPLTQEVEEEEDSLMQEIDR